MRQTRRTSKPKAQGAKPSLPKAKTTQQVRSTVSPLVLYTLHVMLAGHTDYVILRVPKNEHDRVMRVLQHNSSDTFLVIECLDEVVAVRLKDLVLINFCFDFGSGPETAPDEDDLPYEITLLPKGCTEPLSIGIEPDDPAAPGEDNEGQLNNLLCMLDLSDGEPGTTHFLEDIDGEPVIILEHNLSMVRIPKHLIPAWADRKDEGSNLEDEEITS